MAKTGFKIFVNAGHSDDDPGAIHSGHKESKLAMELRDKFVEKIRQNKALAGITIISVPDHLNLRQTIDWINLRADINDFAFSIHFNKHNNRNVNGTEAYYHDHQEKDEAQVFVDKVSAALGTRNRGVRHDSQSWIGSLGWVKKLKCNSVLLETCYLSSTKDMSLYKRSKAALGIENALVSIVPRKVPEKAVEADVVADLRKQILTLQQLVAVLFAHIRAFYKIKST